VADGTLRRLASVVGMLMAGPLPDDDGQPCDRCGVPMILDALAEMWLCANPMCATPLPPPAGFYGDGLGTDTHPEG
jgi:hypothetical protein